MKKYYAVRKGYNTGIFDTWKECSENVRGYSGAEFKSFTDIAEAKAYLIKRRYLETDINALKAYVDGSYDKVTKRYSYGCVLLYDDKVIAELSGVCSKYHEMRNVAGEIMGSVESIKWAISKGYKAIVIYHDYEGIQKWAEGDWKANKEGTIKYKEDIQIYKNKINLSFIKVKAHSGDKFNERADFLAGQALKDNKIDDNC